MQDPGKIEVDMAALERGIRDGKDSAKLK